MADLTNILGPYASSPDASAAAQAFDSSRTRDEFVQKLDKLKLPDEVKANLYDLKAPTFVKSNAPPVAGDIPGMRGAQLNGPATKLGTSSKDMIPYGTQNDYGATPEGMVNVRGAYDTYASTFDKLKEQWLGMHPKKQGKVSDFTEGMTTGAADQLTSFTTPGQVSLMGAMTAIPAVAGSAFGPAGATVGKLVSLGASIGFGYLSLTDAINSSKEVKQAWSDGDYSKAGYLFGKMGVAAKIAVDSFNHAKNISSPKSEMNTANNNGLFSTDTKGKYASALEPDKPNAPPAPVSEIPSGPTFVDPGKWTPSAPTQNGPIRPTLAGQYGPPNGDMPMGPIRPPLAPATTPLNGPMPGQPVPPPNVVTASDWSPSTPKTAGPIKPPLAGQFTPPSGDMESGPVRPPLAPEHQRIVDDTKDAAAVVSHLQASRNADPAYTLDLLTKNNTELAHIGKQLEDFIGQAGDSDHPIAPQAIQATKTALNAVKAVIGFKQSGMPLPDFMKPRQIAAPPGAMDIPGVKADGDNGLSFQKPNPPDVKYDPERSTDNFIVGKDVSLPSKVNPKNKIDHAMALVQDVFNSFRYKSDSQPRMNDSNYSNGLIHKIKTEPVVEQFLQEGVWNGEGVPGIDQRGVVELGNHKSEAMLQSREQYQKMLDAKGTLKQFPMAKLYSEFIDELPSRARKLGMSRAQVEKLIADAKDPSTDTRLPLLVTVRKTALDNEQKWNMLSEANAPTSRPGKDAEVAAYDAISRIPKAIGELSTDEDGNVTGMDKVARNLRDQLPIDEQGKWNIEGTNDPNQDMMRRATLGVVRWAYNGAELAERASENTKDNTKRITNGLIAAAPAMGQAREYAEANGLSLGLTAEGDHVTSDDIGQAVAKIKNFKGKSLARMTSELNVQGDLAENKVVTEVAKTLLNNKNSAVNVQAFIQKYASLVLDEKNSEDAANSPMHAAMGGDPFVPKTKLELVQEASKFVDQKIAEDRAKAKADKEAKKIADKGDKAMAAGAGEVSASQPVRYEKTPAGMQGSLIDEGFEQQDKSARSKYEQDLENERQVAGAKAKAIQDDIDAKNLKQKMQDTFNSPMSGGKKNAPPKSMDMFNYKPEKNPGQGEFELEPEEGAALAHKILDNLKVMRAGKAQGGFDFAGEDAQKFPELSDPEQTTLFDRSSKGLVKPVAMQDAEGKTRPIDEVVAEMAHRVYNSKDMPTRIYMNNATNAMVCAAYVALGVFKPGTRINGVRVNQAAAANLTRTIMGSILPNLAAEAHAPVLDLVRSVRDNLGNKRGIVFVDVVSRNPGGTRGTLNHELVHSDVFTSLGNLMDFMGGKDYRSVVNKVLSNNEFGVLRHFYERSGYSGDNAILHEILADWGSGASESQQYKLGVSVSGTKVANAPESTKGLFDKVALSFVKALTDHYGPEKVVDALRHVKQSQKAKAPGITSPPVNMKLAFGD